MKLWIIMAVILWGVSTLAFAEFAWNEPTNVFDSQNVVFGGTELKTSDNCVVLCWDEGSYPTRYRYLQKFNAQMQPVWDNPIILTLSLSYVGSYDTMLTETSEGCYLLVWVGDTATGNNHNLMATKISSNGSFLWSQSGLVVNLYIGFPRFSYPIVVPDHSGGAYVVWYDYSDYDSNVRLQHINISGTVTMGNMGTLVTPIGSDSRDPDIIVLQNNSVIVSYMQDNSCSVNRFSSLGVVQWYQPITFTFADIGNLVPSLQPCGSDAFYIIGKQENQIITNKYDITVGSALWQQPIILMNSDTPESHNYVDSIVNPDQSIIVSWNYDTHIRTQKMDQNGQTLWGQNGIAVSDSLNPYAVHNYPDGSGGCFILFQHFYNVVYEQHIRLTLQHVSNTGSVLSHEIFVNDSSYNGNISFDAKEINNNLLINWFEIRGLNSGIYAQCFNQQGQRLFSQDDVNVHSSSYGYVGSPILSSRTDCMFAAWLHSETPDLYRTKIYYQTIDLNGTVHFPQGGVALTFEKHMNSDLKAISSPDGETLIVWMENRGVLYLKAQLLDENLNALWEPGGRDIFPGLQMTSYAKIDYHDGAFYIICNAVNPNQCSTMYGQKIIDGIVQWGPSGIELVTENPALPAANFYLLDFNQDFMTFGVIRQSDYNFNYYDLYTIRLNENGTPAQGFNSYGNLIATIPDEELGNRLQRSFIMDGYLYVTFNRYQTAHNDPDYGWQYTCLYITQKISPTGELCWGSGGLEIPFSNTIGLDNQVVAFSFGWNNFWEYDEDGTQSETYNTNNDFSVYQYAWFNLNDQWALFCGTTFHNSNLIGLKHWYYDAVTNTTYFPAGVIADNNNVPYDVAQIGGKAMIIWGSNYSNVTRFYLQLLHHDGVDVLDNEDTNTYMLQDNFPNPFSKTTVIKFALDSDTKVDLSIFNTKGQLVKRLHQGYLSKGTHLFEWDGTDINGSKSANGIYLYKLSDSKHNIVKKMCYTR